MAPKRSRAAEEKSTTVTPSAPTKRQKKLAENKAERESGRKEPKQESKEERKDAGERKEGAIDGVTARTARAKKQAKSAEAEAAPLSTAPEAKAKTARVDYGPNQLKICFWNLNGIRAILKGDYTLQDLVTQESPTIILLNETRLHAENCDEFTDTLPGYEGFFCCSDKKGYAGVAAYVKAGVNAKVVSTGLNNKELDKEGRLQTLEVLVPGFPTFYIVNTYVMNAGQNLVRLNYKIETFNPALYKYLNSLREKHPVLWCGDLNVAYQEIDIWNSKANQKSAGHTPQERSSFGDFLSSGVWLDVFRHHYPDTVQFTYWAKRIPANFANNKGWRLDCFVASKELLPYCRDVITLQSIRASDHCPVILMCAPPAAGCSASSASVEATGEKLGTSETRAETDEDATGEEEARTETEIRNGKEAETDKETGTDKGTTTDQETKNDQKAGTHKEAGTDKETTTDQETKNDKETGTDQETKNDKAAETDKETGMDKETGTDKETKHDKEAGIDKEQVEGGTPWCQEDKTG